MHPCFPCCESFYAFFPPNSSYLFEPPYLPLILILRNSSYLFEPPYLPLILILRNLDGEQNKSVLVSWSQNEKLHKHMQY